jgi:putative FmdB family regulatory protein
VPLYEYQCTKCENRFERIQKFSDPLVTVCPLCGGKVERTISVPAIHFKGTGWYVTDYASKNSAGGKSGTSDEKSAGNDGKSEAKSESKSESNSEKKTESKSTTSSESKAAEKK